ncbi:MAG: extracellular solute-binding protein [Cellulosilyticum sp.]|nr:extracellular solute-binding protein [Cellulosilyticum sp.]
MSKKIRMILLAAALCTSLVGCGGSESTSTGSDNTQETTSTGTEEVASSENEKFIDDGGITWDVENQMYVLEEDVLNGTAPLKLWVDNEGFGEEIAKNFQAKYPNVKIEVQVVATGDAVNKMSLEGEAGTGADVFLINSDAMGSAMNASVIGMMGRYSDIIREKMLESTVSTVEIDGELYGVPYLTESIAMIYNKTLLEQAYADGLVDSAEPATDFNEIIELAKQYNDEATNKWAIRWQTNDSYVNEFFLTSFGYELFGPDGTDPEAINLDTDAVLNGLKYYQSLRPIWNVNSADASWDATVVEFQKGTTPYLISGPWAIETVEEGADGVVTADDVETVVGEGYEYGVMPLPMVDGNQPYTFSGVQIACVSSYTKYPAAARALVMEVISNETLEYAYKDMGKVPAVQDTTQIEGLAEDANVQAFLKQAEFSYPMPSIPEVSYFWTVAKDMECSVWDGTSTPEDAMAKAMKDYADLRATGQ